MSRRQRYSGEQIIKVLNKIEAWGRNDSVAKAHGITESESELVLTFTKTFAGSGFLRKYRGTFLRLG